MNQDFSFSEGLKVPWALGEFQWARYTRPGSVPADGDGTPATFQTPQALLQSLPVVTDLCFPRYLLLGVREEIYTSSVSLVGRMMGLQDTSWVTVVQRVLAWVGGSRAHYGHPDLVLASWAKFHGCGLSKASPEKNLSEDIFLALDMKMRTGRREGGETAGVRKSRDNQDALSVAAMSLSASPPYLEYLSYGKGREVSLLNTSIFENKLSRGTAQMLKAPEILRLQAGGQGGVGMSEFAAGPRARVAWCTVSFPLSDMLVSWSLLFGSLLHYVFQALFDATIVSFLWILHMMMGPASIQVNDEKIGVLGSVYAIPWIWHLGHKKKKYKRRGWQVHDLRRSEVEESTFAECLLSDIVFLLCVSRLFLRSSSPLLSDLFSWSRVRHACLCSQRVRRRVLFLILIACEGAWNPGSHEASAGEISRHRKKVRQQENGTQGESQHLARRRGSIECLVFIVSCMCSSLVLCVDVSQLRTDT